MFWAWSPTGTFVNPGKSTGVSVRTLSEKIRKLMGCGDIPALRSVMASVSRTMSERILLKSWSFSLGKWRISPHSFSLILGYAPVATANKLHEAKGIDIEVNIPVAFTVGVAIITGL